MDTYQVTMFGLQPILLWTGYTADEAGAEPVRATDSESDW